MSRMVAIGGSVRLNSGGPDMTVERVLRGRVLCSWSDRFGYQWKRFFPVECLTVVPETADG
jgi:uncharacterized protein YodC (DUF2158 family)